tara:strand:+ start:58 stop:321 length:264 start_codon:yes stop_codon:yes gene_type:complete
MNLKKIDNAWHYTGADYQFTLTEEKLHSYASLIVQPRHIKIISNTTGKPTAEVKHKLIEEWFAGENETVRQHNNQRAKQRRRNTHET